MKGKKIMLTINEAMYNEIKQKAEANCLSMGAYCAMLVTQKMQIDKDNEALKQAYPEAIKLLAGNPKFVEAVTAAEKGQKKPKPAKGG